MNFANTGTNVSVIFLDKSGADNVLLMDASNLGTKQKIDKNQRTVLSDAEINKIISTFKNGEEFLITENSDSVQTKISFASSGQQEIVWVCRE